MMQYIWNSNEERWLQKTQLYFFPKRNIRKVRQISSSSILKKLKIIEYVCVCIFFEILLKDM